MPKYDEYGCRKFANEVEMAEYAARLHALIFKKFGDDKIYPTDILRLLTMMIGETIWMNGKVEMRGELTKFVHDELEAYLKNSDEYIRSKLN